MLFTCTPPFLISTPLYLVELLCLFSGPILFIYSLHLCATLHASPLVSIFIMFNLFIFPFRTPYSVNCTPLCLLFVLVMFYYYVVVPVVYALHLLSPFVDYTLLFIVHTSPSIFTLLSTFTHCTPPFIAYTPIHLVSFLT